MSKPDWQVTATTIKCDAVSDEVTIMVYPDGTAKCASYTKFGATDKKTLAKLETRAKKLRINSKCEGPQCRRITDYRDKIMAEEGP
ncbi:hypothetical protein [Dehalogenimonas etheniformans]|uniref:Uncharacterized protein n=1 Tax=Dehalogenimonas etheniformans TaxID=1536648 RepID=A0A2P5P957_9CHLR|nr:hypothetical protein [Dehalogenimonas etheniformans]PPD58838.1 hypothetical protein JP09_002920 [Dehalogenimonas etheniformans]QNT76392.1 hypothetical protein HX448_06705 [Dehalogenimonas etheniformans]